MKTTTKKSKKTSMKKTAATKPATKGNTKTVKPASGTASPSVRAWKERPDAREIIERVRAFTDSLARLDLDEAFRLCPVLERKRLLTPTEDPRWFAKHLPDLLFTYADPLAVDDPRDLDEAARHRWLRSLRQPRTASAAQLALVTPDEGSGEVLVNLAVDGEFGPLTGRFALAAVDAGWVLCFDSIDMP